MCHVRSRQARTFKACRRLVAVSLAIAATTAHAAVGSELVQAARAQIGVTRIYDGNYQKIAFPDGDVPIGPRRLHRRDHPRLPAARRRPAGARPRRHEARRGRLPEDLGAARGPIRTSTTAACRTSPRSSSGTGRRPGHATGPRTGRATSSRGASLGRASHRPRRRRALAAWRAARRPQRRFRRAAGRPIVRVPAHRPLPLPAGDAAARTLSPAHAHRSCGRHAARDHLRVGGFRHAPRRRRVAEGLRRPEHHLAGPGPVRRGGLVPGDLLRRGTRRVRDAGGRVAPRRAAGAARSRRLRASWSTPDSRAGASGARRCGA